ncbi:hypothetical protein LUZ63_021378 [Rhynchospora breviuscula]|uniref:Uncharacterized protein n=2 Tax=Rhynchospora breviuscula TaxID=2022672 RepID=A0A9P9Z6Q7_9POAL|nr:hypothetical protein LUZ63_021378 [Rhynchospora breviuscula]
MAFHLAVLTPLAYQSSVQKPRTRTCIEKDFPLEARGSRYTIRAGRYLCDKEFRYLRTVRVTAAVYRGFHSKLRTLLLPTFQHRAGVRLYTSCYHLAESCVFNKQSLPPVATDYEDPRDYGRAVRSALSRPLLVSKDSRPLRKMKKARTVYNEWLVNQSTRWSKTTSVHT